jgi:hypothetical protein
MTTQEAINEAIARGHDAMERSAPTLLDRLRDMGCDREPFTPEHAKCVCRLTSEAANEIERLRTALTEISEGRGPFSRDQLTFATNTIESMKQIAIDALAK